MKKILLITLLVLAVSAMVPLAALAGEHQMGPPSSIHGILIG